MLDNFYIDFDSDYHNKIIKLSSNYIQYKEYNTDSDKLDIKGCRVDSNNNYLLRFSYSYKNGNNWELDTNDYYVYMYNDNNLYLVDSSNYEQLDLINCYSNIEINNNSIEDLLYSNKSSDILIYSFYLLIPVLLVVYLVKVFRKGVH